MALTFTDIYQGDSRSTDYFLTDYLPTQGWTLHAKLIGPDTQLVLDSIPNGDLHTLSITSVQSALLSPGAYVAYFYVTNSTDRTTLSSTRLDVFADPLSTVFGQDYRSFNERMVDALEALLERRANNGQLDLLRSSIDQKEIERLKPSEINDLLNIFKNKVRVEQGKTAKRVLWAFGSNL